MLSIGEFSKISTVTTNTLRYYDEINLLKPAFINKENNYRYYDINQLKIILLINKLKKYHFSLDEIITITHSQIDGRKLATLMQQKQQKIQQKIIYHESILTQINIDINHLKKGENIMSYLDNIKVELVEFKPINIFSLRTNMKITEFSTYIDNLYQLINNKKLTIQGAPMTFYYDKEFNPDDFDAEIAIPVKEHVDGTRLFSNERCAMARLEGPYTELASIYIKIVQWIDANNYHIAAAPFEIYLTNPKQTKPENNITEVYFPVMTQ